MEDGTFALFFHPHPAGFDSSRVPAPGNSPSKAKKMLKHFFELNVLTFFWPWMANSRGQGLLSYQIQRGGDEKRGLKFLGVRGEGGQAQLELTDA